MFLMVISTSCKISKWYKWLLIKLYEQIVLFCLYHIFHYIFTISRLFPKNQITF